MLTDSMAPDGSQVNKEGEWVINSVVQTQSIGTQLPKMGIQSSKGDLYYSGLRHALDSVPLYPMETTGSDEVGRLLDAIFAQIITEDMDTHDKLKACYDYIIQNTEYGSLVRLGDPYLSAYGTFIFKEGVCDTYSAAYAVVARKSGVPMYMVGGETHKAGGGEYEKL